MDTIIKVIAGIILDSDGRPGIEAAVQLADGTIGSANIPGNDACEGGNSQISCQRSGRDEAMDIKKINEVIGPIIKGRSVLDQADLDRRMLAMEESPEAGGRREKATMAVSMAIARAAAKFTGLPFYRYLGGPNTNELPVPIFNILSNSQTIQEYFIIPAESLSFTEALRTGSEIYHAVRTLLKEHGLNTTVSCEGSLVPLLNSPEEALHLITAGIAKAGYQSGEQVFLGIKSCAPDQFRAGQYYLAEQNRSHTSAEIIDYYANLLNKFPIFLLENGLSLQDRTGREVLTNRFGKNIKLADNDIHFYPVARANRSVNAGTGSFAVIKLCQASTVTQIIKTVELAKRSGYRIIISHCSRETEDTFIADLSLAVNAEMIKCGAPARSDRTAKYNRLLRIEGELRGAAQYSGVEAF